jgi:FtsH-binding integral membrane protein
MAAPPLGAAAASDVNLQPTLAYRDVREDRKGSGKRFLLQMLGGFGVAMVICGACFAGLFGVGMLFSNAGGPSSPSRPHAALAWLSLAVVTAILVGVVWWAIRAHRRRARTGFFVGMLIGVGLCLLPLGLCYWIIGDEAIR